MRDARSRVRARALALSGGIVAAALALASIGAAAEPYRLEPGDVLEFSVPSIPELNQQTMVDVDGGVTLPLFGSLPVDGLTLPEVQEKVRQLLSSRTFRRTSDDGREIVSVLEPDDVSITVAEYRPVYLTGDVATPGAQAYRPGMTARQAIAVAGGYDLMHFRATDPFLESADLKSDYDVLWTEFARHQAEIWRIDAELAGKTVLSQKELPEAPLPPQEFAEMINLQNALLQARVGDYQNELSFLNTGIGQADGRRSDLAEQQRIAEDGRAKDTADLEALNGLFDKGGVAISRIAEVRRAANASSLRVLEAAVDIAEVNGERDELSRELERLDSRRQVELLQARQEAEVALANVRSRLQAVNEKLLYVGLVKSQLLRGAGGIANLAVTRGSASQSGTIGISQDTELLPGDVVEVTLRPSEGETLAD
jgi:polysaccharide biosynthesis/export protein